MMESIILTHPVHRSGQSGSRVPDRFQAIHSGFSGRFSPSRPRRGRDARQCAEGEGKTRGGRESISPGLHRDRDAMYTRCIERDRTTKRARCDATQIRKCIHGSSPLTPQSFLLLTLFALSSVLRRIVLINIRCPNAKIVSAGINAFL